VKDHEQNKCEVGISSWNLYISKENDARITEFEVPSRYLSSKYVFSDASVQDHSKLSASRNFVVELLRFEVKPRKNYRIRGSKPLNFTLNRFFSHASLKGHSKLSAHRNFVVELVHFEVKRGKNYRIRGSGQLTFL
jgi:hypothetical protein